MSTERFEAGSEFGEGSAIENLASLTSQDPDPAPQTASEVEPPEAPDWAEPAPDDEPPTEQAAEAPEAAEPPVVEIEAGGRKLKFNLDPEDPQLKRALAQAAGVPGLQRKLQQIQRQAKEYESAKPSSEDRERLDVMRQLESLTAKGEHVLATRAFLGQDGFEALRDSVRAEVRAEMEGDQEALAQIRGDRQAAIQQWKEEKTQTEREQEQARIQELEDRIERDRLKGFGQAALERFDMGQWIDDADTAEQLNQMNWKTSFQDLADLQDAGEEITQSLVRRVFARNAKVLRGRGTKATAETQVREAVDQTKTRAAEAAKVAATANYPQRDSGRSSPLNWDGKSLRDLVRQAQRATSR